MNNIVLYENISVLQLRIEKIFDKRKDISIITYLGKSIRADKIPMDTIQIIIDADNLFVELETLLVGIRQIKALLSTPIILLSSRPNEAFVVMAAKYGKTDILVKPFSDIEFLRKVLKYGPTPSIENIALSDNKSNHTALKWSNEYKIGDERIDEEHKQIVDNFEQLYIQITNGNGIKYYDEMLSFLEKYVDYHFKHEQEIQQKIAYDDIEKHIQEHKMFQRQVEQVIQEHNGKKASNQDLIKLVLFIKEWLIHHLLIEDKKLGDYIRSINKV